MRTEVSSVLGCVRDAGERALRWSRTLDTTAKHDGSPVTALDIDLEEMLIQHIRGRWPEDSILSEEAGAMSGTSRRRWILDPLDGTARYLRGDLSWGTHVSLELDGKIVFGVISRPALGRLAWAVRGCGAQTLQYGLSRSVAREMKISSRRSTDSARIVGLLESPGPALSALSDAGAVVNNPDFAVEDLASGRADVLVDDGGKIWDQAPAKIIVREAGGTFSDLRGGESVETGFGVYSNGALHAWALSLLKGVRDAQPAR